MHSDLVRRGAGTAVAAAAAVAPTLLGSVAAALAGACTLASWLVALACAEAVAAAAASVVVALALARQAGGLSAWRWSRVPSWDRTLLLVMTAQAAGLTALGLLAPVAPTAAWFRGAATALVLAAITALTVSAGLPSPPRRPGQALDVLAARSAGQEKKGGVS